MIDICPTITAADARTYRVQIDQVVEFASRIHIDVADGTMTPNTLLGLDQIWWPGGMRADIHVMMKNPLDHLENLIALQPQLIIVHAEAEGDFVEFSRTVHHHGIEAGAALLPQTPAELLTSGIKDVDHVLIFSGHIGYFGGHADLSLLSKVQKLKQLKPSLEIGWDGGINDHNAPQLVEAGVEVLNAGGYIHGAARPEVAYQLLQQSLITKVI